MLTRLKYINRSGSFASGNPRLYYRPPGQKGIPMPDLPRDHHGFLAAYAKAAGVSPKAAVVTEGSLGAALVLYKRSDRFAGLASNTRAQRRPIIDDLIERYGSGRRGDLRQYHIENDLSRFSGHVRNNHLKVWRGFCAWMKDHYKLAENPSDGIKKARFRRRPAAFHGRMKTWPPIVQDGKSAPWSGWHSS